MKDPTCGYSKRYTIFCGQSRRMCKKCYVRQMSVTYRQVVEGGFVEDPADFVHVCDRCGAEIGSPDSMIYVGLQNRKGGVLVPDVELCFACGAELAEWLKGEDFFLPDEEHETPSDVLWGDKMVCDDED